MAGVWFDPGHASRFDPGRTGSAGGPPVGPPPLAAVAEGVGATPALVGVAVAGEPDSGVVPGVLVGVGVEPVAVGEAGATVGVAVGGTPALVGVAVGGIPAVVGVAVGGTPAVVGVAVGGTAVGVRVGVAVAAVVAVPEGVLVAPPPTAP